MASESHDGRLPPSGTLVDRAPDAQLLIDEDGMVRRVSDEATELLGYSRDELIGMEVERLVPEHRRGVHRAHRTRFRVDPRRRPMASGLDLHARGKDGTLVPVEIALSPIEHEGRQWVLTSLRDVTARHASRQRRKLIDRAMDATGEAVFLFNVDDLRFVYVNRGAVEHTGYERDELLDGMTPLSIKPEFSGPDFEDLLEPLKSGELANRTFMTTHRRKNGTDVAVEITLELPDAREGGSIFVAIARDVSHRLERELDVRGRLRDFEAVFDHLFLPTAIVIRDGGGWRVVEANEQLARMLGRSTVELRGADLAPLIEPADAAVIESLLEAGTADIATPAELRLIRPDGERVWVETNASPMDDPDRPGHTVVHFENVTARVEATVERNRHRRASAMLEDRERIARELHDMVIQRLFAAGMGLQAVAPLADGPVADRLEETVDTLDESIAELRSAIFNLSNSDRRGSFSDQVHQLVRSKTATFSMESRVTVDPAVEPPEQVRDSLLATLGEALANVGRHAAATRVEVGVDLVDDHLVLTVRDDGVGLDPDAPRGNGIDNMMWRATSFGGRCVVEPAEEHGTLLRWEVPATPA